MKWLGLFAGGLLVLALLLTGAFLGHAVVTGIGVPYPDPTPQQAAHERYHLAISGTLFLAAGACWLVSGVLAVSALCCWLAGRLRPSE